MSMGKMKAGRRLDSGAIELGAAVDINSPNGISGTPVIGGLSTTKALVFFIDGVSAAGRVRVVNMSDVTLTLGASSYLVAAAIIPNVVIPLSDTLAVVGYPSSVAACSVSGDVVTVGSPVALEATAVFISGCRLSATTGLICYVVPTGVVRAVTFSVSGTTITLGTPANASDFNSLETSAVALDSSTAAIAYRRDADNTLRLSALHSIGAGFTRGDDILVASNAYSNSPSIPMLSVQTATTLVAVYTDISTPTDLHAALITFTAPGTLALTDSCVVDDAAGADANHHPAGAFINLTRTVVCWFKYDDPATTLEILAETLNVSTSLITTNPASRTSIQTAYGVESGDLLSVAEMRNMI